jgi:two-component system chemotaxis response regulator CheY
MDKEIKIMVVDDLATMRKVIRNLLKQVGYDNIVEAEDGVMALKMLKSQKIDFVISDWNMPKLTGMELLKTIRGDEGLKATPFLMVTADGLQDHVIAAVRAGVNNYIVKPFTAEVLSEKITKILEKR